MPRPGETPQQREVTPGIKRWVWADGTPLNDDELVAAGVKNWDFGRAAEEGIDGIANALGFNPTLVPEGSPGSTLATGPADDQRRRTQEFVASLSQQAATGDGAWQQSFSQALNQAQNNASALGQANEGSDYGSSLTNIGNAQAGVRQRGVAEGDMLREQQKLDARGKLDETLRSTAQMDLTQSAEQARIERERRAANQASINQTQENRKNTESAIGGGLMGGMGMSEGGEVPGSASYFGDDERNDVVHAKLSPEEIVIPRSITERPDAPRAAAEFVAAVQAGHDPQSDGGDPSKLAEGGVPHTQQGKATDLGPEGWLGYLIEPHVGREMQYGKMRGMYGTGDGGELDTAAYDQTAAQQDQLTQVFASDAAGRGPSIAAPMLAKSTGDTMGAALAAQTRGGAPQADVLKGASAVGVDTAADVGRQRGREQSSARSALGMALTRRRGQEQQLASAKQQAAFSKTLADMNLSLQNQAQLRGAIGAAGQGAAAFAGADDADPDYGNAFSKHDVADTGYLPESGAGPEYRPEEFAKGGIVARGPAGERLDAATDKAAMTKAERAAQQASVYEEETGMKAPPKTVFKRDEKRDDSLLSRALSRLKDAAKYAGASTVNMYDGGYVSYDPSMFSAPAVQPVPTGYPMLSRPELPNPADNSPEVNAGLRLKEQAARITGRLEGEATLERDRRAGLDLTDPAQYSAELERRAAERSKLKTLAPRSEAQPDLPVAPAPAPAPHETKRPGPAPRMPAVDPLGADADRAEAAAIETNTAVERELARAKVDAAAAKATAAEQAMLARKEVERRAQAATADAMTRYKTAADEMSRITATVDPGRFWASRTTGQKVMGWIGMILGAAGAGPDGINKAAVMLNQAVDRDLEAQKADVQASLKKAGAKVDAAKSFYAMAREATGDELAAADFARAAALEAVALRGEQAIAAIGDPAAKARGLTATAAMKRAAQERRVAGQQRLDEHNLKWAHISNERTAAERAAGAGGAAAAKEVREAVSSYQRVAGTVSKLKGLINDTNVVTEKVGPRSAQMETIAASLLTEIKDAEHLGALDKGTWELADKLIGDPTATFTLDTTKLAKLDALLEQSRAKAQATIGATK